MESRTATVEVEPEPPQTEQVSDFFELLLDDVKDALTAVYAAEERLAKARRTLECMLAEGPAMRRLAERLGDEAAE